MSSHTDTVDTELIFEGNSLPQYSKAGFLSHADSHRSRVSAGKAFRDKDRCTGVGMRAGEAPQQLQETLKQRQAVELLKEEEIEEGVTLLCS